MSRRIVGESRTISSALPRCLAPSLPSPCLPSLSLLSSSHCLHTLFDSSVGRTEVVVRLLASLTACSSLCDGGRPVVGGQWRVRVRWRPKKETRACRSLSSSSLHRIPSPSMSLVLVQCACPGLEIQVLRSLVSSTSDPVRRSASQRPSTISSHFVCPPLRILLPALGSPESDRVFFSLVDAAEWSCPGDRWSRHARATMLRVNG
ncbi:hypothetical protein DFH06DRAFT_1241899 [Mycena polygramma]|nr:hypothetical protein DFH06DRAFT_1241899 [Mycena polygramma]